MYSVREKKEYEGEIENKKKKKITFNIHHHKK